MNITLLTLSCFSYYWIRVYCNYFHYPPIVWVKRSILLVGSTMLDMTTCSVNRFVPGMTTIGLLIEKLTTSTEKEKCDCAPFHHHEYMGTFAQPIGLKDDIKAV
ncbi:hypothetical protein ACJX0J_037842, partial [Zea mays]